MVEGFLTHPDPQLRSIALEVLTRHWRLKEHWNTARNFLERDPDKECRINGASALAILKRNTQDRPTLSVLARVVRNEQETRLVREAAYAAMRSVIRYDPREQFHLAAKGINSAQEIDWKMVDAYL